MECNKDEAFRAKQIAEEKFLLRDFVGAKKFALKARQLFPDLDGLPQLIVVLDVHLIAHDKLNGAETNWYAILEVDSTADEATIRKQYRKFALLLHPDKNKAVGAEAAFKLIAEAWRVLCGSKNKAAHDLISNGPVSQVSQNVKAKKRKEPPPASNRFQAQQPFPPPRASPCNPCVFSKSPTFWTSCTYCKMKCEYLRVFENQNLACPTCYRAFVAKEIHVPGVDNWWNPPMGNGCGGDFHVNGSWNGVGACAGFSMVGTTTSFMAQQAFDKVKSGKIEARREYKKQKREVEKKAEPKRKSGQAKRTCDVPVATWAASTLPGPVGTPEPKTKTGETLKNEKIEARREFKKRNGPAGTPEPKTKTEEALKKEKIEARREHKKRKTEEEKKAELLKKKEIESAQAKKTFDRLMAKWKASMSAGQVDTSKVKIEQTSTLEKASESKHVQELTFAGQAECSISPDKVGALDRTASRLLYQQKNVAENSNTAEAQEGFHPSKKIRALDELSDGGRKPLARDLDIPSKEVPSGEGCMGQKHKNNVEGTISFDAARDASAVEHQIMENGATVLPGKCKVNLTPVVMSSGAIDVPDPDFYDFDKDRTESHFKVGQVWAIYDDDDGMPRFYARISKLISLDPFRVQMAWLEPRCLVRKIKPGNESAFAVTCGEFKNGKAAIIEFVNTFSHSMPYEKLHRGAIKIYPRKGEVWAICSSPSDAKSTPSAFAMVEILKDFEEGVGVTVAALGKLEGFKTLFSKQGVSESMQCILLRDLSRFSHFAPAYQVTPHQVPGLVDDCWDIDPAATPMNLVTGITLE